jgi:hypothetical protein
MVLHLGSRPQRPRPLLLPLYTLPLKSAHLSISIFAGTVILFTRCYSIKRYLDRRNLRTAQFSWNFVQVSTSGYNSITLLAPTSIDQRRV